MVSDGPGSVAPEVPARRRRVRAAQKLGERGELAYESSRPVEVQLAGIDCRGLKPDPE